jgi:cyclase
MPRVIPCLLLRNKGLVKTVKFKQPKYVGDPINAIKIFNEKECDELIFLDIMATTNRRPPPFDIIEERASECFMPVCYGGGLHNIDDIRQVFALGIEKISLGSAAVEDPALVREASDRFGSQSVVVCLDVKKSLFGKYEVVTHNGKTRTGRSAVEHATTIVEAGAGELLLNSVDRDGTMTGYDADLVSSITDRVDVPVIACGGAGSLADIESVVKQAGASSGAAGSLFVFYGKHRAVLISYPAASELREMFGTTTADPRRDA